MLAHSPLEYCTTLNHELSLISVDVNDHSLPLQAQSSNPKIPLQVPSNL
jgi:hypothetical protein